MYTSTLVTFALFAAFAVAVPVPLNIGYNDQPAPGDANAQRIERARVDANVQIQNMQNTLANPDDPVNRQRILDAFGPQAKIEEIRKTVNMLQNGHLQVESADPNVADAEKKRPALAKVQLNKKEDGGFHSMGSALIGSRFHKDTFSDRQRAGTLIHEATHQLALTGDDVITQGIAANIVVPTGIRPDGPASHGIAINGGYARDDTADIHTAADLSNSYKQLRDNSPNMHQNADSYRVFAALCSRSLYKRALLQEDPVGYYLARRQSCTLPPDYFAKKAAAKAEATKNMAGASKTGTTTPEVKAKSGLATKKGVASTTAKGQRAAKGAKGVKATKATKGAKAAKGSKATKATKGMKVAKGMKAIKAPKGVKATKASKGAKSSHRAKIGKVPKGGKRVQGTSSPKSVQLGKNSKSAKVTKASGATGGKPPSNRKAEKITANAVRPKVPVSSKTVKSVAKVAASVTKKGGKMIRRDLESILEELD